MAQTILILGGVRSGKSRFAQDLAARLAGPHVVFVATAEARDAEMSRRIQHHQSSRPNTWKTLECPTGLAAAVGASWPTGGVVLVDCLTLLVSNLLLQGGDIPDADEAERRVTNELNPLREVARSQTGTLIIVSGEVGLGLVPENPLGRLYRDLLGWANQHVAGWSRETYFMVAGHALPLSRFAHSVEHAAARVLSEDDQQPGDDS